MKEKTGGVFPVRSHGDKNACLSSVSTDLHLVSILRSYAYLLPNFNIPVTPKYHHQLIFPNQGCYRLNCVPCIPKSNIEVLIPITSECNLIGNRVIADIIS